MLMLFQPYFVLLTPTNVLAMKMHLQLVMVILSASVSGPDKKSWDIMHPGIFMIRTKQLPLKVPGKAASKGIRWGNNRRS